MCARMRTHVLGVSPGRPAIEYLVYLWYRGISHATGSRYVDDGLLRGQAIGAARCEAIALSSARFGEGGAPKKVALANRGGLAGGYGGGRGHLLAG